VGTGDLRDVSSVFNAWMPAPDERPLEAVHGVLGWQQQLGGGFNYLVEGYYKRMRNIPVPLWRAVAVFTTTLARADGEVHGIDARIEYGSGRFYGFVGYGYSHTEYASDHPGISADFGDEVQRYNPPHDRRHQLNALASLEVAGFEAFVRWQFGSGLPYTSPQGFDEAFNYVEELYNPSIERGATRMVLDRPFNARLPTVHRLDVSVERGFDLTRGRLTPERAAPVRPQPRLYHRRGSSEW
jgi:hypothetical protein